MIFLIEAYIETAQLDIASKMIEDAENILDEYKNPTIEGRFSLYKGLIDFYIHQGGKLGVLVEINCETDFVARTEQFQTFTKDVAMHIAAANPIAINREDIPLEIVEKEKEIFAELTKKEGKPDHIIEKIVQGRLDKFYAENSLLEQNFVKDPDKTIKDLITDAVAKLGENILISRFSRFQLGEKISIQATS